MVTADGGIFVCTPYHFLPLIGSNTKGEEGLLVAECAVRRELCHIVDKGHQVQHLCTPKFESDAESLESETTEWHSHTRTNAGKRMP